MRSGEMAHVETMELQGLVGAAVSDFVDVLVGTRSSTAAVRAELSERTDGTPLFLEEMVRSLADVACCRENQGSTSWARRTSGWRCRPRCKQ